MEGISVIIPALNEEQSLGKVLDDVIVHLLKSKRPFEIIVVDDGSSDQTSSIAKDKGVKVIRHPMRGGYGLSIRDGILNSKYEYLSIIDADGSYPAEKIPEFCDMLNDYDMVVGARTGEFYRQSLYKFVARKIFQVLCEFVTGVPIPDANSGLRAFRKDKVLKFKESYCLGFSFTTTITLAFHLKGYFVKYQPISYYKRIGKSHVRMVKDTLTSTQIITQAILYYNPIKLFLLIMLLFLGLSAVSFVVYFAKQSFLACMLGQTFLIIACIYFGIGLIVESIRHKRDLS